MLARQIFDRWLDRLPLDWYALLFFLLAILAGSMIGLAVIIVLGPLKSVAALVGLFIAILAVMRPETGLLAFVFVTYTRFSDVLVDLGAPSIAKPFVGLLVGVIVLRWALYNERPQKWQTPAILVSIYGVVIFSSLIYASDVTSAENAFSDYIKDAVITVIMVMMIQKQSTFRQAIWALLAAGIFLGSISVYQYLTSSWSNDFWGFGQAPYLNISGATEGVRLGGPIGDPNYYAQIMLALIPLAFNRLTSEKAILPRVIAGWAFGVCVLTVIFTYSRGAFLAMMIMLIVMSIYRPPRLIDVILAALMMTILLRFVPATYLQRLVSLSDILGGSNDIRGEVSFRGRASEMTVGIQMFLDHPLLGVGMQNYPNYYQQYSRRLGMDPRTENREPHSLYLEIASETGLAGLLTFGAILWAIFSRLRNAFLTLKRKNDQHNAEATAALMVAMIGYLTAAIFIHGAFPRFFYLLAGISMASLQVAQAQTD